MRNWNRGRKAGLAGVAAVCAALLLFVVPWAHATAGSKTDGDDTAAVFDVKTLAHDDNGHINSVDGQIIYTVTTYDAFSQSDHFDAKWHLYDSSGGEFARVHVMRTEGSNNTTTASVENLSGQPVGNVDVTFPSDGKSMRVTFTTKTLADAGLGNATSYEYWFEISSANGPVDFVPDGTGGANQARLTHTLSDTDPTSSTTSTTKAGGTGSGAGTGSGSGSSTSTTTATTVFASSSTTSTTATGSASGTSTTGTTAVAACGDPVLTATPNAVQPGDSTTLSGRCFPSNTDITITMASTPVTLAVVRSDGNGTFLISVVIPRSAEVGTHTISATGGGKAASVVINVGGVAFTGVGHAAWVPLAIALIFAGLVLGAGKLLGDQHEREIRQL